MAAKSDQQEAPAADPDRSPAEVAQALTAGGSPLARVSSQDVASPPDDDAPDDDSFGRTRYLRYDLALPGIAKQTAVFWPSDFDAGAHVDLILYLHGWRIDASPPTTMKQYFGRDYGGLREALDDSGQNAVLVAPTLGDHSEAGRLLQHGQLDALLSAALAATRDLFAIEPQTTLRNFYLAAHSGGGSPMRSLAGGADNGLANLQECWSLDAANNFVDEAFWPGWAKARSADLGYFYFRRTDDESTVPRHVQEIGAAGRPNLVILPAQTEKHMFVPVTHWRERAEKARGLEPKAAPIA